MENWNSAWEPGMKCSNEDCNNALEQSDCGNLCSGYMDTSVGERWCNCCSQCRIECHNGALDEIDEED